MAVTLDRKKLIFLVFGVSFLFLICFQLYTQTRRSLPTSLRSDVTSINSVEHLKEELKNLEDHFDQKLSFHIQNLASAINKKLGSNQVTVPPAVDRERTKVKNFEKWLKTYSDYHNKVTSGEIPISNSNVKFVRCVGINGFGNAMQSIVSCFLYALASNRIFLLSAETPFPFGDYFRESPIDYYAFHLVEGIKEYRINSEDLVCDHYSSHKKKVVFMLGGWGYDYYGQSVVTNPHYNLTETLPLNFYELISDYLFRLTDDLQAKVDNFKKAHFNKYTVAIQIRATIPKSHSSGDWYKGTKDHEGHPIPPLSLFIQAAEMISNMHPEYGFDDVNWYIVTQDVNIVKNLRKRFGKKIAFYEGKIVTTFDEDPEGQETSFLTWWIMGECDDHITTESSSYGTTAAARAGVAPVVCNHGRWCARRLTPQPCQQVPYLGAGESDYPIMPPECLQDQSRNWNTVESSCAFFEAIIRDDPRYERGDSW